MQGGAFAGGYQDDAQSEGVVDCAKAVKPCGHQGLCEGPPPHYDPQGL